MAATLEVAEHHHTAEVADVETVGGRVNAEVGSGHAFFSCSSVPGMTVWIMPRQVSSSMKSIMLIEDYFFCLISLKPLLHYAEGFRLVMI